MSLIVQHNLTALNTANCLKSNSKSKAKLTEKLSSGYRINRAADDAAGLAISEKMRLMIRSLNQGTQNGMDGISWCQTGDGALDEAHEILQRMNELAIKSLNETNSESDRAYMEQEFRSLKEELNRIGKTTEFNTFDIFDEYQRPCYKVYGGVQWEPSQMHVITEGSNELTIQLSKSDFSGKITITVPPGEYTTRDLMEEIDMALFEADQDLSVEYDSAGYCNAVLQNGQVIESVSGSLSYLIYQTYEGGTFGALIGTTQFVHDYDRLGITPGKNDFMSFSIEDFENGSSEKSITIPEGRYTRQELIDLLNTQLSDTTIRASAYGTGIKLGSDTAMVTGFKGNMFKIDNKDEGGKIYNSVFYDNVQYGSVTKYPAVFTGAAVLPTDARDVEHQKFIIDSSNNTLVLQPNSMENSVTLTIGEGEYTADEMRKELNNLFIANNLDLSATVYSQTLRAVSGIAYRFQGLQITSGLKGLESKVNFDTSSSAYRTLFEAREYNDYMIEVRPVNETRANAEAYFNGTRIFPTPVTVTDANNQFRISINTNENGATVTKYYNISLSKKQYNNADDFRRELMEQLDKTEAKGLLDVKVTNGMLTLTGAAGKDVNSIRVTEYPSRNGGYDTVFVGHQMVPVYSFENGANITLNTPLPAGTALDADANMTLQLGGTSKTISLKRGDDQAAVKQKVEAAFPTSTTTIKNEFLPVSGSGRTSAGAVANTARGGESTSFWADSAKGFHDYKEGNTDPEVNIPASLVIASGLSESITLKSDNNQFKLTLNGETKLLILTEGTYDKNSLRAELQTQIDQHFGTGMGGAEAALDGNNLVLISRLPKGCEGGKTSIECSTADSSFLRDLHTTRTPAEWRSTQTLLPNMTIDSSNNTFIFQYTENGTSRNIQLTLDSGSYLPASMINNIQRQLDKTGTGIQASLSGGRLALTTKAAGSGVSISYTQDSGGSSANTLFKPMQDVPADILVNLQTQNNITIDDSSNQFSIVVNGTRQTVTLKSGSYDRERFKDMLNEALEQKGVEAYIMNGKLGFQTTAAGAGTSLAMDYANGGSSMEKIYGTQTITNPGITASFTANGNLQLSSTDGKTKIYVNTSTGGSLMQPVLQDVSSAPAYNQGYHSQIKSSLTGQPLSGSTVVIDQWNNDLSFTFQNGSVTKAISIEVPGKDEPGGRKDYAFDELEDYLQKEMDRQAGSGLVKVTVNSSGVKFEAEDPGIQYQFSNPNGDFYQKILCKCEERSAKADTESKDGYQDVDQAFTVGRQDVKNKVTTIKRGISDELSLDLTFDGEVHPVKVVLDAGNYTGDALKAHLQSKLDEALADMGLQAGLIEVGIGNKNTGVSGSNDENALSFSLAKDVSAPAENRYIIDGIGGNAAFAIFYKTDGDLIPAHIIGTKDISQGVVIGPDDREFRFEVDDVAYQIQIPTGAYTTEEILDTMNNLLDDGKIPAAVSKEGNFMMIAHKKLGDHSIANISGGAKDNVFFREEGKEPAEPKQVWLSNEQKDRVELPQESLSTMALHLNSCSISKTKYANKAVARIANAIDSVSAKRSNFGVVQNRLEHALNNNQNKAENTQSAESLIRDTDMAREMVRYACRNIVEQTGQAILAQANQVNAAVLALL